MTKLAGILAESAGWPLDDPPAMVSAAVVSCLRMCEHHGVAPVGSFEMVTLQAAFPEPAGRLDRCLRWEFTPVSGAGSA